VALSLTWPQPATASRGPQAVSLSWLQQIISTLHGGNTQGDLISTLHGGNTQGDIISTLHGGNTQGDIISTLHGGNTQGDLHTARWEYTRDDQTIQTSIVPRCFSK